MGAAYFIALDHRDPGFDPFVNGQAIARDARRLGKLAASLGLKTSDDYVSIGGDEAAALAEEFGVEEDVPTPGEAWFDADEGLMWVGRLRAHLESDAKAVKDAAAVLSDLAEYERVLSQAKSIGAKWHLSVDF